ncbi:MAG: DsbA family protein [Magnetospirillum sp.]|nr:DsbA family protein [Magnetospirillum sp.]
MKRRTFLVSSVALGLSRPLAAATSSGEEPSERVFGSPQAAVTIIEFSSFTCPHCATFHRETLPQMKRDWIASGRARLVFHDFPLDTLAFGASMIAHRLPGDRFFAFADALFLAQDKWMRAANPLQELKKLAAVAGLSSEQVDASLHDQAVYDRLRASREAAEQQYGIDSTPSFAVAGKIVRGALPYAQFAEHLAAAERQIG